MLSYWCVRECKKVMHFASFFQTHQQNWFLLIKRRWSCILSAMFATITHPEETLKKTFTGEKFKYRRRYYSTSPRILVKQSSEWESSLTHLETFRMWVIYQQSIGELNGHQRQKPFETRGYRIYNIMAFFHKVYSITRHWHQFVDGTTESVRTLVFRSFNSVDLQLPLTSIDFMITRVRQFHVLRDSNDEAKDWESTLNIKTDGKFSAKKTVQESLQIPDA